MKRTKRRDFSSSLDRGMTLIEVVVVIGVLAILSGWMRPIVTQILLAKKHENVRSELNILARALERYWYDNHTSGTNASSSHFPTSLDAEGFYGVYYPADPDIYTDEFLYDENDNTDLWRSYQYLVTGTPKVAYVWSVAEDGNDEQTLGAGDDIMITVTSERIGRIITRKKLRDIGRAVIEYIVGNKLVSSSDAWSLTDDSATLCSTNFGLDSWYDRDGWGNYWQINTSYYRIYSKGPDGTDDTGDNATALADDDIGW